MSDFIAVFLPAVLMTAAMTRAIRWLAERRLWQHPGDGASELVQPPAILKLGLACTTFCCMALTAMHLWPSCRSEAWVHIAFIGAGLCSLSLVADYYLGRHFVDADGVEYGRVFGPRYYFRWDDVVRVSHSDNMDWFRLELDNGATARISLRLIGLPNFARHLFSHVAAGRIDGRASRLLRGSARGELRRI